MGLQTRMTDLNIRICCFDDAAQVKRAIASVPTDIPTHVFDGRYATFPGEYDLTPGLRDLCGQYPHVRYYSPDPDHLPFGHERLADGVPPEWRPGVHAKARWMYRTLPQDEWVLKLDSDEVLTRLDIDIDRLDPKLKTRPLIRLHEDDREHVYPERLWIPERWTTWIDDCVVPRELFSREYPLERLHRIWANSEWTAIRFLRSAQTQDIVIDNYGGTRPLDYQARRADHLKTIGRDDRWTQLKREIQP